MDDDGQAALAHPTAEDVLAGEDLRGQRFLVTGGYRGIGLATCRALAGAGADVVVAGRDRARAVEAVVALRGLGPGTVEPLVLDLADPSSVVAAVEALGHTALRAVVANAGVMACPLRRTALGWEWHVAVNLLGHALLVRGLQASLARNEGRRRVVLVTAAGEDLRRFDPDDPHLRNRPYDEWEAHGRSKAALGLLAVAFQQGPVDGLDCFAVRPGRAHTAIDRHVTAADRAARGRVTADGAPAVEGFVTTSQAAVPSVLAATDRSLDGTGGRHLGQRVDELPSWAVDSGEAARVWTTCEQELDRAAIR